VFWRLPRNRPVVPGGRDKEGSVYLVDIVGAAAVRVRKSQQNIDLSIKTINLKTNLG
jgi:hypothetical protein